MKEQLVLRLTIVGDEGVGKTSLLSRYVDQRFSESYCPTIGVDFKFCTLDNSTTKLQIWDTAGQKKYQSITAPYLKGTKLFYVVYDVTKRESFENVQARVGEIRKIDPDANIVLIGNKAESDKRVVAETEGRALANTLNCLHFYEADAKSGLNVHTAFINPAREIAASIEQLPLDLESLKQSIDGIRDQYKNDWSRWGRSLMTFGVFGFGSARKTSLRLLSKFSNQIMSDLNLTDKQKKSYLQGLLLSTYLDVITAHKNDRLLNTNQSKLAKCISIALQSNDSLLNQDSIQSNPSYQDFQKYKAQHASITNSETNRCFLDSYFRP